MLMSSSPMYSAPVSEVTIGSLRLWAADSVAASCATGPTRQIRVISGVDGDVDIDIAAGEKEGKNKKGCEKKVEVPHPDVSVGVVGKFG